MCGITWLPWGSPGGERPQDSVTLRWAPSVCLHIPQDVLEPPSAPLIHGVRPRTPGKAARNDSVGGPRAASPAPALRTHRRAGPRWLLGCNPRPHLHHCDHSTSWTLIWKLKEGAAIGKTTVGGGSSISYTHCRGASISYTQQTPLLGGLYKLPPANSRARLRSDRAPSGASLKSPAFLEIPGALDEKKTGMLGRKDSPLILEQKRHNPS